MKHHFSRNTQSVRQCVWCWRKSPVDELQQNVDIYGVGICRYCVRNGNLTRQNDPSDSVVPKLQVTTA
mgnify:CR=1 FL=1